MPSWIQACEEAAVLMAVAAGRRSDVDKRATSGEHGVESNSLMPSPVLPCSHHRGESATEEVANAHEAPITAAGQRCSDSAEEEDSLDENDMIRLLDELQEDITYDQDEKEFMDWLQASMTGSDVHSHPSPSPEQSVPLQFHILAAVLLNLSGSYSFNRNFVVSVHFNLSYHSGDSKFAMCLCISRC